MRNFGVNIGGGGGGVESLCPTKSVWSEKNVKMLGKLKRFMRSEGVSALTSSLSSGLCYVCFYYYYYYFRSKPGPVGLGTMMSRRMYRTQRV